MLDKNAGEWLESGGNYSYGIFRCIIGGGEQGATIQREEQFRACGSKSFEDPGCVAITGQSHLFG
jgi:hypothetical protein